MSMPRESPHDAAGSDRPATTNDLRLWHRLGYRVFVPPIAFVALFSIGLADRPQTTTTNFRAAKQMARAADVTLVRALATTCDKKHAPTSTFPPDAKRLCFRFILSGQTAVGDVVRVLVSGPHTKLLVLKPASGSRPSKVIDVTLARSQFAGRRGLWFGVLKINGQQVGQPRFFVFPSIAIPPTAMAPPPPPPKNSAKPKARGVLPKFKWLYDGAGKVASVVLLGTAGCLPGGCTHPESPEMEGNVICHHIRFDLVDRDALELDTGEFTMIGHGEGSYDPRPPSDLSAAGPSLTWSPQSVFIQGWFPSKENATGVAWASGCTDNWRQDDTFNKWVMAQNDQALAMEEADKRHNKADYTKAWNEWLRLQRMMMQFASFSARATTHG